MEERRGACNILVGRPDGKRTLTKNKTSETMGRPGLREEDNIKIDLQEVV